MNFRRFNLSTSVILSAALHVAAFATVLITDDEKPIIPVGVELQYGDSLEAPAGTAIPVAAVKKEVVKPVVQEDNSDAPSLDKKEQITEAPQQPEYSGTRQGLANGTVEKGALAGREGFIHGQEVSEEDRYIFELKKLLERKKLYPQMARRLGQTGKVTVRFVINKDGTLSTNEVIAPSQYDVLNRAAADLVKSIDGIKPFPEEIKKVSWEITVPIEYTLN
jgi:TonB family C-terminal domain